MPSKRRFRDDGTKATRLYKADDGDDQMYEKDEDVVHAGIVSKSQKIPEFKSILEFATHHLLSHIMNQYRSGLLKGPTTGILPNE
jgi:hypothetical protein